MISIAVLPTGTKMRPTNPQENEFYEKGLVAYVA
jgi:hypothetical protein